jgi:3'-phosphoadenosine 5'-phosphosulfate sulfotransferase (PAPS reductase)/FAD synthetase
MQNRHEAWDLKQMQSLPLEAKIRMTKMRIQVWYESWTKFEIFNKETGKTRFVTMDTRDQFAEPKLKDSEYIKSVRDGQVYVSFSGGKDSTVLKHIVDSMYDDVPAVFVNTGLEYPEIQRFVKDIKDGKYDCFSTNVEIVRPEMRFDQVLKTYGYPVISKEIAKMVEEAKGGVKHAVAAFESKKVDGSHSKYRKRFVKYKYLVSSDFDISSKCCDIMKKKPAKLFEKETGRKAIVGTMANESSLRYKAWMQNGCNAFTANRPISQPLSFWTEQDVFEYIKRYNIPYCSVYGDIVMQGDDNNYYDMPIEHFESLCTSANRPKLTTTGCDRTGCVFCMFGCHLEKGENRFQRLQKTHPRQYEYCIGGGEMVDGKWQPNKEGLGLGHVLDYINVKYD